MVPLLIKNSNDDGDERYKNTKTSNTDDTEIKDAKNPDSNDIHQLS